MVQEQLDIHMWKMNLDTNLNTFIKINSSRSDLCIRYKTMKLFKGDKKENLEFNDGNGF